MLSNTDGSKMLFSEVWVLIPTGKMMFFNLVSVQKMYKKSVKADKQMLLKTTVKRHKSSRVHGMFLDLLRNLRPNRCVKTHEFFSF